jgi:hypothetical protein
MTAYTFNRIEIDLWHGGITLHGMVGSTSHPIRITADDDPVSVLEANRVSLGLDDEWIDMAEVDRALAYRGLALAEPSVKANLVVREQKRKADAEAAAKQAADHAVALEAARIDDERKLTERALDILKAAGVDLDALKKVG